MYENGNNGLALSKEIKGSIVTGRPEIARLVSAQILFSAIQVLNFCIVSLFIMMINEQLLLWNKYTLRQWNTDRSDVLYYILFRSFLVFFLSFRLSFHTSFLLSFLFFCLLFTFFSEVYFTSHIFSLYFLYYYMINFLVISLPSICFISSFLFHLATILPS